MVMTLLPGLKGSTQIKTSKVMFTEWLDLFKLKFQSVYYVPCTCICMECVQAE